MPSTLPEPQLLVLLANQRRRLLCRVLRESTTPLPAGELADRIADREFDDPSVADRRAVYRSLHHDHLPRLEDADVVAYEATEGGVTPGLHFDAVMDVLGAVTERERPWSDA